MTQTNYGLALDHEFERYVCVSVRDTVEEKKVRGCGSWVRLRAFPVLPVRPIHTPSTDEAALYNAAAHIHCKAGRSCSITAVMTYLTHAHHWPLSRTYAFVVRCHRSPNIGSVSEFMAFEACELGGRQNGTEMAADDEEQNGQECRLPHSRESLPPTLYSQEVDGGTNVGLVIGPDIKQLASCVACSCSPGDTTAHSASK